jgi:hypothetical protein
MQLPEFIYTAIEKHNTSLGDNSAFPKREDIPFELLVANKRFEEVLSEVKEEFNYIPTIEEAEAKLSKALKQAKKLEEPLQAQLEKLCQAIVETMLGIPEETVIYDGYLTTHIKPEKSLRILPEYKDEDKIYTFDDVDEIEMANKVILKRRLTNSLVQGASYTLMKRYYNNSMVDEWCPELLPLYKQIILLNDFLLFSKEEKISDKNPMLGAYVETHLGKGNERTVISAQGLIYPFLLQEMFRGFFELFASHGLPQDTKKANYILHHADFLMAEAWDLRMGVPLWQLIERCVDYAPIAPLCPYLFSSIVQIKGADFNKTLQNIFAQTRKGKECINDIVGKIIHDREYQQFKKDIDDLNIEKTVLGDEEGDTEDNETMINEEGAENTSEDDLNNAWADFKSWQNEMERKYGTSLWFSNNFMAKYHPDIEVDPEEKAKRKALYSKYEAIKQQIEQADKERKKAERLQKARELGEKYNKSEELFDLAIEEFGLTSNLHEAGYILPNGSLLKLGANGRRDTDHRAIEAIYYNNNIQIWDNTYRYNYVVDFMNNRAIRIDVNTGLLDMTREPTPEQYRVLSNFARISGGDIDIDFTNETGNTICSASYENAKPQRIVFDIKNFYENNINPIGNIK